MNWKRNSLNWKSPTTKNSRNVKSLSRGIFMNLVFILDRLKLAKFGGFLPGPGPCGFLLIQKKGQLSRPFKLSLIKLIIQRNA